MGNTGPQMCRGTAWPCGGGGGTSLGVGKGQVGILSPRKGLSKSTEKEELLGSSGA